ncbi:MAG: hypothetical protein M1832_005244 [Thelocarpon impressellum]|nr:MAG: hypothetical protein M1832_005244 [Thelocarpon impressellum]
MTLAGLNTINLSTLNTFQQILLLLLIMLGSAILVSAVVVHVRKRAFEAKFQRIVQEDRKRRRERSPSLRGRLSFSRPTSQGPSDSRDLRDGLTAIEKREGQGEDLISAAAVDPRARGGGSDAPDASANHGTVGEQPDYSISQSHQHIVFSPSVLPRDQAGQSYARRRPHTHFLSMQGVGARAEAASPTTAAKGSPAGDLRRSTDTTRPDDPKTSGSFMGRNSQFHHLTWAEREELGGVEYRAIRFLAIIVPLYYALWLLLGSLGVGAYVANNKASVTRTNGINPWWVGVFNAVSAFNNSGMSLLDLNMIPFQSSIYMLITMGLMILAGNTCYPIFLRLIIWVLRHLLPAVGIQGYEGTLQFLLDHPRRCYTNLFPAAHTYWLLFSVVVLNSVDWIAFEVLNVVTSIPPGSRVLDGLFQALAVRSGGFYIIGISSLRISLQVLYVIMMYISVFPVVITMRNSNVYEERSLGLYAEDLASAEPTEDRRAASPSYFVRQQLRAQLAHDLWWIVLAVFFITIIETSQFESNPAAYSVFNVIFEVISAYGCVGISTGLPDQMYSFSGGWHKLSKLILCAVMIRGRHRGLPVAIDRAVLLPGEHLAAAEEEDAMIRMERSRSRGRDEMPV